MTSRGVVFIGCVLPFLAPPVLAADDPVGDKLDKAKAVYEADAESYRAAVAAWFDKREDAAREKGDKKAVDQVKAERRAFADKRELPRSTPAALKSQLAKARSALEAAYEAAIREYTKAKQDDEATAVEKELESFKAGAYRPVDAVKFGGKFYKVLGTTLTWREAKKKCEEMGGRLVVIDNAEQNDFVTKLVAKSKVSTVWLGASDEQKQGVWVWVDGRKVKYDNWDRVAGQPNNADMVEHYIVLLAEKKGLWWDYPNDPKMHPLLTRPGQPGFVCQWE